MEKDIMEGKPLRQSFNDLKQIIASPIKFFHGKGKQTDVKYFKIEVAKEM
jgi:hypothetical protein